MPARLLACGVLTGVGAVVNSARLRPGEDAVAIGTGADFHGDLIGHAIRWDDGFGLPPDAPGLGIAVDEALLAAHAYGGDRLHLDMQEEPCDWRHGNAFRGGAAD